MRGYVSISAHGFGHLAQIAPVISALKRRMPDFQLCIRSGLPRTLLEQTFPGAEVETCDHDFGIPMQGIHCAPRDEIWRTWKAQCSESEAITALLRERLREGKFNFVVSGISPWPLAAAGQLGLPSFGIGSFTWSAILEQLLDGRSGLDATLAILDDAYAQATRLFSLTPGIGMRSLPDVAIAQSIGAPGEAQGVRIRQSIGAHYDEKLVVLAFGGMPPDRPIAALSENAPWRWIGPRCWTSRPNYVCADDLPFAFKDVLASADLVITKAGYGIATELAALAKPAIIVRRPDWPEDEALTQWAAEHCSLQRVDALQDITIGSIQTLLDAPFERKSPVRLGGEQTITDQIYDLVS